jgi:hypothetical protein
MEHDWIKINKEAIDKPRQMEFRGLQIEVTVSPYDLPEAVRSFSDDGKFIIEFKYLGAEETISRDLGNSVRIEAGRNTQRVHRIELELDMWSAAEKGVRISMVEKAMESLGKDSSHKSRTTNHEVVREVILDNLVTA